MKDKGLSIAIYFILILAACAPAASEGSSSNASPALSINMNPLGTLASGETSQVSGTAQITPLDNGKTKIVVSLSGLEPNSSHMGHIHVGDCSVVGPVALGLSPVEADASGNGTATAEVPSNQVPATAYIAYHQRGPNDAAGVGSFISCGDIK